MKLTKNLRQNQTGMAAITVTVFVLVILSLTVLAFSQISRREQQQTLDRQLSNQAFYVAESGINDATRYLRDPANEATLASPAINYKKEKCSATPIINQSKLDSDGVFKETCVLFDRAPETLEYSSIDEYTGELVSLKNADDTKPTPRTITIEWHDTDGGSNFSGCTDAAGILTFPNKRDYPATCDAGMMRLTLMPVVNTLIGREKLVDDSYTVFARPVSTATSGITSFSRHADLGGPDNQGSVVPASCSGSTCKLTIQNIMPANGLFLHMRSLYINSAVTVKGQDISGGTVRFKEGQIMIDSTGKVSDVLKRMQVRLPYYPKEAVPPFAFEAMNGICKRIDVYSDYGDATGCGGATYFQ